MIFGSVSLTYFILFLILCIFSEIIHVIKKYENRNILEYQDKIL